MTAPKANDIPTRVTKIEAHLEHFGAGLVSLEKSVGQIAKNLETLTERQAAQGKMNWPLLVSVFGLLIGGLTVTMTFMVTIGAMSLTPIRNEITRLDKDISDHARIQGHTGVLSDVATMRQKFAEVETQFRGIGDRLELQAGRNKETIDKLSDNIQTIQDRQIINQERIRALEVGLQHVAAK